MGERGEVAGRADRALFGNNGRDALGKHRLDQRHDAPAHAGGAATEGEKL